MFEINFVLISFINVSQFNYNQYQLIQSRSSISDFITQNIENFNANIDRNNIIINIKNERDHIVKRIQKLFINFKLTNLK